MMFNSRESKLAAATTAVLFLGILLLSFQSVRALLMTTPDVPANALIVDESGHWFVYADTGAPYFMAGLGGPENFLYKGNRQKQTIVNDLLSHGGNAIYIHSIRSHGGDGKSHENPFNNPDDPNSGVNTAVLDNWDTYLSQLDEAGITIWFNIYDDGTRPWGACNPDLPTAEKEYIATLVNQFKHYRHLVWLPTEEHQMKACDDDGVDVEKARAIAAEIRLHDPVHPIGVHHNTGQSFLYADDPNIKVFGQQICADNTHRSVDGIHNQGAWGNYVYVMAECHPWHKDLLAEGDVNRAILRQSFWASAMAGGYVLLYDAYEKTAPTSALLKDLKRLHDFMMTTRFNEMAPDDGLAFGGTKWVMANPGRNLYLLYSNGNPGDLGVQNLAAGEYDLVWYNPINGNFVTQAVTVTDGNHAFDKPAGIGREAVLYLTGHEEPVPTNTPTRIPTDTPQAEVTSADTGTPAADTPEPDPSPEPESTATPTSPDPEPSLTPTSDPDVTPTPPDPEPSLTPTSDPDATPPAPEPSVTPTSEPTALPDLRVDGWNYFCGAEEWLDVEIIGAGMGNDNTVQNPQVLAVPNVEDAAFVIAQVAIKNFRTGFQPQSVTISTDLEHYELFEPTSSGIAFHYEAVLQPAELITAFVQGVGGKRKVPRAVVAYVFHKHGDEAETYAHNGRLIHAFIYGDSHTESLEIATADAPREVNVTFVLTDLADDSRTAVLQVEAGEIMRKVTVSQPNLGDELLIYTLTISDVPGDIEMVYATVISPPVEGDSLYWSGINVSTSCP